jgi:uncharacterized protein involved in exopolysaccharide biosynthesis
MSKSVSLCCRGAAVALRARGVAATFRASVLPSAPPFSHVTISEPTSAAPKGDDSPQEDVSLWSVVAFVVRSRVALIAGGILGGFVAVAIVLLSPNIWTSRTTFLPQSSSGGASQIASLAAQFGVSVGEGGGGDSPEFYAELVRSRGFLLRVAAEPVPSPDSGTTALATLLEVEAETQAAALEKTVKWLQEELVVATTNATTGLVSVAVKTKWPAVSHAISAEIAKQLDAFVGASRRSSASEERTFVEAQLEQARAAMTEAEERMKAFLVANRQYQSSPDLRFEFERLQREMLLRQQLFSSLSTALQQARISEVRDTPVITIVERPYLPALPDKKRPVLALAIGGVVGTVLALFVALVAFAGRVGRSADPQAFDVIADFLAAVRQRRWKYVVLGR